MFASSLLGTWLKKLGRTWRQHDERVDWVDSKTAWRMKHDKCLPLRSRFVYKKKIRKKCLRWVGGGSLDLIPLKNCREKWQWLHVESAVRREAIGVEVMDGNSFSRMMHWVPDILQPEWSFIFSQGKSLALTFAKVLTCKMGEVWHIFTTSSVKY